MNGKNGLRLRTGTVGRMSRGKGHDQELLQDGQIQLLLIFHGRSSWVLLALGV